jgi:hypothetical protein
LLLSLGAGIANKIDAMRRLKVALAVAEAGGDGDDAVINPNVSISYGRVLLNR